MLEATKLAILAKEKFSRVQELYKVFTQNILWNYSPSIPGAGQPAASREFLEVLPVVGFPAGSTFRNSLNS